MWSDTLDNQTTQPTSGEVVTAATNSCANCVVPSQFTVFGQAGHADPLVGWRCFSQKQVISRLIQVQQHQRNESGFVISTINKYMLGSRYP